MNSGFLNLTWQSRLQHRDHHTDMTLSDSEGLSCHPFHSTPVWSEARNAPPWPLRSTQQPSGQNNHGQQPPFPPKRELLSRRGAGTRCHSLDCGQGFRGAGPQGIPTWCSALFHEIKRVTGESVRLKRPVTSQTQKSAEHINSSYKQTLAEGTIFSTCRIPHTFTNVIFFLQCLPTFLFRTPWKKTVQIQDTRTIFPSVTTHNLYKCPLWFLGPDPMSGVHISTTRHKAGNRPSLRRQERELQDEGSFFFTSIHV